VTFGSYVIENGSKSEQKRYDQVTHSLNKLFYCFLINIKGSLL